MVVIHLEYCLSHISPWYQDELAVAVESLVEDDPVLASPNPVSDVASFHLMVEQMSKMLLRVVFHLREWFGTIISLAAAIAGGSSL